jgi:hypothetical protein
MRIATPPCMGRRSLATDTACIPVGRDRADPYLFLGALVAHGPAFQ